MGRGVRGRKQDAPAHHAPVHLLCLGVGLTNGLVFQGWACIFRKRGVGWGWGDLLTLFQGEELGCVGTEIVTLVHVTISCPVP